jgi:hypothetical protein
MPRTGSSSSSRMHCACARSTVASSAPVRRSRWRSMRGCVSSS